MNCLCLVLCLAGTAQDGAKTQPVSEQLERRLRFEAQLIHELTGTDEKTLERAFKELDPVIASEAKRIAGHVDAGAMRYSPRSLPLTTTLRSRFLMALGSHVTPDVLARVTADAERRDRFERELAVNGLLTMIDHTVFLRRDQFAALQQTADRLVQADRLNAAGVITVRPSSTKRFDPELARVLTAEQMAVWQAHGQGLMRYAGSRPGGDRSPKERSRELTEAMKKVAAVRFDSIVSDFGLSKRSARRIELAAKGAIQTVVETRLEGEERAVPDENGRFDGAAMELATLPLPALFESRSRWKRLVQTVLDEKQKQELDARLRERAERTARFIAGQMLWAAHFREGGDLRMSGEQLQKTTELMAKAIGEPAELSLSPRIWEALASIPDDAFQFAMGEKNWDRFRRHLPGRE